MKRRQKGLHAPSRSVEKGQFLRICRGVTYLPFKWHITRLNWPLLTYRRMRFQSRRVPDRSLAMKLFRKREFDPSQTRGFTLIELLVVVGLMAILFSVAQTAYTASQRNSRDAKRRADLEVLRQAIELYRSDNPTLGYPAAATGNVTALIPYLTVSPNQYISPTNFPADPQSHRTTSARM